MTDMTDEQRVDYWDAVNRLRDLVSEGVNKE